MQLICINIETERDPSAKMPEDLAKEPQLPPIGECVHKLGQLVDPLKIEAKKREQLAKHQSAYDAKCESIIADHREKQIKWEESCALHATRGRICCLGVITPDGKMQVSEGDSEYLTREAVSWLLEAKKAGWRVVGHNCRDFDIPFIYQRALIHGIPTSELYYPFEKWDKWPFMTLDTMQVFAAGRREYVSLGELSEAMGFGARVGNGKDFARLYRGTAEEKAEALSHLTTGLTQVRKIAERML